MQEGKETLLSHPAMNVKGNKTVSWRDLPTGAVGEQMLRE